MPVNLDLKTIGESVSLDEWNDPGKTGFFRFQSFQHKFVLVDIEIVKNAQVYFFLSNLVV